MSQMRKVLGTIGAMIMGCLLLWFVVPMLWTVYNTVIGRIDTTDPNIQAMVDLGTIIFRVMGIAVILVVGWNALSNATERDPYDV